MGRPQSQVLNPSTSGNNNLYPKELQLKLYQALIFSIPILFSIILFLLFYLFYLKRRASNLSSSESSPPQILIPSTQSSSLTTSTLNVGIKGDLKDRLQVVHFDEHLRSRDSQCCVCLGEFELGEELQQVPHCKHMFHSTCIRSWLQKNATCPLCRCHVITSATHQPPHQPGSGDGNGIGQGLVGGVGPT